MKKITKYAAILSVCCLSACNLDVLPPTGIPSETYWQNATDAWNGMNALYRSMPAVDIWDEMTTDNAHSHKPWEGNFELVQNGGVGVAATYGSYSFEQIRNVNILLQNIGRCEMDENVKARMVGEARVLRALAYMRLTAYYGKVAILTEPLAYDDPAVARNSVEEVQAFILKELAESASALPERYQGGYLNETSRITKGAALALRARAALYYGNYAEAEASAKGVMNISGYDLFKVTSLTDAQKEEAEEMKLYIDFAEKGIDEDAFIKGIFSYEGLWQTGNANANNPEFVLWREYTATANQWDVNRYTFMIPMSMSKDYGFASYEPMQDLVDAYWDIDGKTIRKYSVDKRKQDYATIWDAAKDLSDGEYVNFATSENLKGYEYVKEFRNRDSRLYASIMFPFKSWHQSSKGEPVYFKWNPAWVGSNGNEVWTGFAYRKMVSINPTMSSSYGYSTDPYPVVRYAEVLLTFAEARTANSGYDSEVVAALNKLRDRCGMPNVPTGLGREEALELIRNERRIELAAEGHRYNDIRRYGSTYASKAMTGPSTAPDGSVVINKAWNDRIMLMPIPQSAIDKNPLLDQNPGY
ncbi:MAG: RagB/SusD family nutrient uptake outer membrane protein [Phocaeicola sp.]